MGISTLRKRTFAHPWAIVRPLARCTRTRVRPQPTLCHWHECERSPLTGRSFALEGTLSRDLFRSPSPHLPPSLSLLQHNPFHTALSPRLTNLSPTTTNHHQSLQNHHSQKPPVHTHHLRPPHSSPLPHFPFSTNFTPLSPNIHNSNHIDPFGQFFYFDNCTLLFKSVVAFYGWVSIFFFFLQGVGIV
jgi:hypothetical protein